jgi:oxygen-independent coproporphyrinogen-3 oxidase
VFIGGGTPTLLSPGELRRLFEPLKAVLAGGVCREFTVEANPATLDDEKASLLVAAGVDRLSLGAQSFHAAELEMLERIHSPQDVAPAVETARRAGIGRLNLDLIFGIPGQTASSWAESLDRAMELEPDHLSMYSLMYEPGTTLTSRRDRGRIQPYNEDQEAELLALAIERVAARGYEQYEISNYARPGQRCLHNLAYWNDEPYVGAGPSAVGYIDGVRYRNVPDVERYCRMMAESGSAVIETETVSRVQLAGELAMLRLRLVDGIDVASFTERTGFVPHAAFARCIEKYTGLGMLVADANTIALTRPAQFVADAIIADFMAELDEHAGVATKPRSTVLPVITPQD